MLIYTQNGKMACLSKRALELAGYTSLPEFLEEHEDYSELFIKKPGYIYNFEHFSWITFLKSADAPRKRVLIRKKELAIYECDLSLEVLYPVPEMGEESKFYYQIHFDNLHLVSGEIEERVFEEPQNELQLFESSPSTTHKEEPEVHVGQTTIEEETRATEPPILSEEEETKSSKNWPIEPEEAEEIALFTESAEQKKDEIPTIDFSWEEESAENEEKEESAPLEMMDFSFEEEEKSSAAEESEPYHVVNVEVDRKGESEIALQGEEESKTVEPPEEAQIPLIDFESSKEEEETLGFTPEEEKEANTEISETVETPELKKEETEEIAEISFTPPDLHRIAGVLGLPETLIKSFLVEMVETYDQTKEKRNQALAEGDVEWLHKEAYKMKGIANNLLMDEVAEELDTLTRAESDAMVEGWKRIDAYMAALKSHLQHKAPTGRIAEEEESVPTTEQKPSLQLNESGEETIAFDPEEAAGELGLPASLIIEFANDFVQQAHDEKTTFLEAYSKGDLNKINETAHKLKGVAANLRIEDMRALMEKVQHADTMEKAAENLQAFYRKLGALRHTMQREYT